MAFFWFSHPLITPLPAVYTSIYKDFMLYFVVKTAEIMEKLLKLMCVDVGFNSLSNTNLYPGDGFYLVSIPGPNQNVCYFIVLIEGGVYCGSLQIPDISSFENVSKDVSATKKENMKVAPEREWIGSKTLLELVRILKK